MYDFIITWSDSELLITILMMPYSVILSMIAALIDLSEGKPKNSNDIYACLCVCVCIHTYTFFFYFDAINNYSIK